MTKTLAEENKCTHEDFAAKTEISRFENGQFMMEIRIQCIDCGLPFEFQGLNKGIVLGGAAMSPDAQEARLSIIPSYVEETKNV